jgi:hypothetical protein
MKQRELLAKYRREELQYSMFEDELQDVFRGHAAWLEYKVCM